MTRPRLVGGMLFVFGVINAFSPYAKHVSGGVWLIVHWIAVIFMLVVGAGLFFGKLKGRGRA